MRKRQGQGRSRAGVSQTTETGASRVMGQARVVWGEVIEASRGQSTWVLTGQSRELGLKATPWVCINW